MIRLSTIVPVVVGLAAGVFAVMAGMRMIQEAKKKARPPALVPLVVARTEIPYGAKITEKMLKTVPVYPESTFGGGHRDPQELVGRVVSTKVVADAPVTDRMLAPKGTPPGAENQIPLGYSPVSVLVKSHMVEDLDPGNHVDVYFTPSAAGYGRRSGQRRSKLILQNVEVFSVGRRRVGMERPAALVKPATKGGRVVTPPQKQKAYTGDTPVKLLVRREDVIDLNSAASNGEITLVMRCAGDDTVYEVPEEEPEEAAEQETKTAKVEVAPVEPLAPPPPPAPETRDVEIIIGGQKQTATFLIGPPAPPAEKQGEPKAAVDVSEIDVEKELAPKPVKPLGE